MRHARRLLLPLGLATAAATAQDWRLVDPLRQVAACAAFDAHRGRVVTVGDRGETREWDGAHWLHRPIAALPALPIAMAFDAARGVTVALTTDSATLRTFTFDGSTWTERTPPTAPPMRLGCGLAFDALRQRLVLFGGGVLQALDDTWEWDGITWQQRATAARPAARSNGAMAFDLARGRCVLFGGEDAALGPFGTIYTDTWEWDGTTWTQVFPATVPSATTGLALAYDAARQRSVLFGSGPGGAQTWEFDGATWQPRTGVMPPSRYHGALTYDADRARCVLFGGRITTVAQDLWELDAAGWTPRPTPIAPAERSGAALAHAATRDRTVLFGGYVTAAMADTWEWDGRTWQQRQPPVSPPPRSKHSLWSDGTNVYAFGGLGATFAFLTDTWRFDGTTWLPMASAQPPPARQFQAVAYDPTNGGALLFGGQTPGNAYLGDTWSWGAGGWTLRTPSAAPSPRAGAAIAAATARNVVVLWGGVGPGVTLLADTWEWDGVSWHARTPAHVPVATGQHTMTFEPGLGVTVLLTRTGQYDPRLAVWVWTGVDWTPVATQTDTTSSAWLMAAATVGAVRLHDGEHLVELSDLPPRVRHYGTACGSPPPRLDADAWPRPDTAEFAVSFAAHTPNAPIVAALATQAIAAPLAGCTLLVRPDGPLAVVVANGFGAAALPVPLPPLPGLVGFPIVAQAWSLCATGVCATDGLELTLGR